MRTIKDLKDKIQVGTKIVITHYESDWHPQFGKQTCAPVPVPEKMSGARTVTKKDTTGFYLSQEPENDRGSFCGWPTKKELHAINDNAFTIDWLDSDGTLMQRREYTII